MAQWIVTLYILNTALLFTHQVEAGYWKEWELFHLPGGVDFFLVANLLLLIAVLFGLKALILGKGGGILFFYRGGSLWVICFFYSHIFSLAG